MEIIDPKDLEGQFDQVFNPRTGETHKVESTPGTPMEIKYVPMFDTGIGREMGFGSDKEFIEAQQAELRKLPPDVRGKIVDAQREFERRFLLGE